MACILAALGMMPFKGATAPASSSTRLRVAEESGKLAVQAAAYKQQYPFCDMTNVDAIMRNLFDGFIPQQDSYSIPPDLYTT